jgi:hypothetical protein
VTIRVHIETFATDFGGLEVNFAILGLNFGTDWLHLLTLGPKGRLSASMFVVIGPHWAPLGSTGQPSAPKFGGTGLHWAPLGPTG